MRKLLSVLFSCCLCCLATFATAATRSSAGGAKVCLCHVPPGDPADQHTICVGPPAVRAHLGHGDFLGECPVVCGGDAGNTCPAGQFCKRDVGLCGPDDKGVCTREPATCQQISAPVCGCNGTTYDNACLADAAGVSVEHAGACETQTACGGTAGATCEADQFCKRDEGACAADAAGVCERLPVTCPSALAPVCGCDGTTYTNSCFADAAGIAVQHDGPCEQGSACGGVDGGTCPQGEFCKPPLGHCAAGDAGDCASIPPVCSGLDAPVCGCDGKTYANPCLADAAGVGVDHPGACGADQHLCGGTEGATCATGQFCDRPIGACAPDASGLCRDAPEHCPAIVDPACGCDGTTYSNACVADAAGVAIASPGPCEPPRVCGGESGAACLADEFCKAPPGVCTQGAAGVCADMPVACPVILDEVCGCDGMTYRNRCFADAAGVTVDHAGACAPLQ
jgi:hypothetical protein